MLLNGVFDMQDQELFKTPSVLVYPAGFCQAFRAAEIQRSLWWGLWSPRGCAWQPHQKETAREVWGLSWEMDRAGPCSAAVTCAVSREM